LQVLHWALQPVSFGPTAICLHSIPQTIKTGITFLVWSHFSFRFGVISWYAAVIAGVGLGLMLDLLGVLVMN
jgi:hypothetical protein